MLTRVKSPLPLLRPPPGATFSAQTLLLAPTDADPANGGVETAAPTQQQQQQMTLKCSLCEMKFVNAFRLAEHMRLHSAHTDSGSEKRRLRVAKRGEKSRRNATLFAVERAVPSPPIALPKSTSVCSAASSSTSSGVQQFSNGIEEGETEID
ncbi:hypothetical protein niasHT_021361 [Heterodera trifolii]|uniref:C2H2-type domain-containing protein n=1 Tax=Heterodera trifolii TaxID=157864 RepID=A0ABD2K6M7_9BILA